MSDWNNEKIFTKEMVFRINDILLPCLEKNGFTEKENEHDQYGFIVIFENKQKYIRISCSIHSHDYPFNIDVYYGNKSSDKAAIINNEKHLLMIIKEKNINLFNEIKDKNKMKIVVGEDNADTIILLKDLILKYLISE